MLWADGGRWTVPLACGWVASYELPAGALELEACNASLVRWRSVLAFLTIAGFAATFCRITEFNSRNSIFPLPSRSHSRKSACPGA